jgi:hypothetical protein
VLWAVENGITAGTSAKTFSPKKSVTFGQMFSFLWAYTGKPQPGSTVNPFTDVPEDQYYCNPILWAYYGGILVGNENTGSIFHPDAPCSRAYVVTYLYNYFVVAVP